MKRRQVGTKNNEIHMSHSDTRDNGNNPPRPPFAKGGNLKSPFGKGGYRGIFK